jgi:hypothetical protein
MQSSLPAETPAQTGSATAWCRHRRPPRRRACPAAAMARGAQAAGARRGGGRGRKRGRASRVSRAEYGRQVEGIHREIARDRGRAIAAVTDRVRAPAGADSGRNQAVRDRDRGPGWTVTRGCHGPSAAAKRMKLRDNFKRIVDSVTDRYRLAAARCGGWGACRLPHASS